MTNTQCEEEIVPVDSMDELLTYVMGTRNFATQAHILANDFHLSNKDAESLLLERIYHRLQSGKEFNNWVTTWSRKDCERSLGNEHKYKSDHIDDSFEMDSLANPGSTEVATELSDEVLRAIFPDDRSFQFVSEVLKHGKQQAMNTFGLTKQQFNSRLNHRLKYLDKHQELLNKIVYTDERKELKAEQECINEFFKLLDSPLSDPVLNRIIEKLFTHHDFMNDYLDRATKEYQLKYQAKVVHDFMNGGLDSRKFIQFLYNRVTKLDNQLNGSDDQ